VPPKFPTPEEVAAAELAAAEAAGEVSPEEVGAALMHLREGTASAVTTRGLGK